MGRRHEQTFLQRGLPDANRHMKSCPTSVSIRDANQNYNEIPPYLSEWLKLTRQETTNVGEDVERKEPLCTVGGMQTGAATVENGMAVPQEMKNRITI